MLLGKAIQMDTVCFVNLYIIAIVQRKYGSELNG